MDREESVLKIFPSRIRQALEQTELNMENLQEIRVRVGQPLLCVYRGRNFFWPETESWRSRRRIR